MRFFESGTGSGTIAARTVAPIENVSPRARDRRGFFVTQAMATKPTTLKRRQITARHEPEPPNYGTGRGGRPWRRTRDRIMKRDGYLCQCPACKQRPVPRVAHEVDHIVPRAEGGTEDDTNLQAINRDCHKAKTLAETLRGRKPAMGRGGSKV